MEALLLTLPEGAIPKGGTPKTPTLHPGRGQDLRPSRLPVLLPTVHSHVAHGKP